MVAVANSLKRAGARVLLAGGGAGSEFVSLHGYDEFEPTNVDFIDTYQGNSFSRVVTESLPASRARVADYCKWLREEAPDAIVTDDMFAAMAAVRTGVPLYVLKHDMPSMYEDHLERLGAAFHVRFQLAVAREFYYPAVWPPSDGDPSEATRVPPVALESEAADPPSADVVVVPSYYSDLDRTAQLLEREGYDVLHVGCDDWEPVGSLVPYIREADAVVCSGYSTIMEAAVAGTFCVISPATAEQEGVARWIDEADLDGFCTAESTAEVVDAVASAPSVESSENGADVIASRVLAALDSSPAQPTTVGPIASD